MGRGVSPEGSSMYDVVIIGAGITGCAAARYLSRYSGQFLVLERDEDVCTGTSKANSAIIHAGYDARHGTKMAEYNVRGSQMYEQLAHDLDFPYQQNGSLVVTLDEDGKTGLKKLHDNGVKNGVQNLKLIDRDELRNLEPNISDDAKAALYAPTGAIICPFLATIALAENAVQNGVEFRFNSEVTAVEKEDGYWTVQTGSGCIRTKAVVNAAGVYADVFHNMVSEQKIHITPRRGEYCLLDRNTGGFVRHTVFQLPDAFGKGVLVTPTVHGNTLIGPTAVDDFDKEGIYTTAEGLKHLTQKAGRTVKNLPMREVITSFAGLRAHEDGHEFLIGEVEDAPGFFDCAGIESPGLSSAPAIGLDLSDALAEKLNLPENKAFIHTRTGILNPNTLSFEERQQLILKEPSYGNMICRCEKVTEGEIREAIRRPIGATSLDGVKRRVRAGMGRCQGGFCSPRVMEILAEELNIPLSEVTKCGGTSRVIVGEIKEGM